MFLLYKNDSFVLVMGNGHARARYCPPARYFCHARLARCPIKIKLANARLPVPQFPCPGRPRAQMGTNQKQKERSNDIMKTNL